MNTSTRISLLQTQDSKCFNNFSEEKDEASQLIKKNNVQLQVDEEEMKRRISAFMSRKRKEVDEWTVQEFCNRPYNEETNLAIESDSCARVDAVFIPRFGSKSHVKVSKVQNRWGPQTQQKSNPISKIETRPSLNATVDQRVALFESILERIQNMEAHLQLKADNLGQNSIFQRLKIVEDKILYLEGTSPDYIASFDSDYNSSKNKFLEEKEKVYLNWSIDELQRKIHSTKEYLKEKSRLIKLSENNPTNQVEVAGDEPLMLNQDPSSPKKDIVQLQIDENEVRRRIDAFISRKRKEVDESIVRSFCSRPYIDEKNPIWDQVDSCARVDAVYIPKSRFKTVNCDKNGSSILISGDALSKRPKFEPKAEDLEQQAAAYEAAQDHIHCLEEDIQSKPDSWIRNFMFQRLKELEDRILELEKISPEYFKSAICALSSPKKKSIKEKEKAYSNWTVNDIQKRMQALKDSLKAKTQIKKEL